MLDETRREIGGGDGGVLRLRVRDARDVGGARRAARTHLAEVGVPADAIADVVLALSELATNAIEATDDEPIDIVVTADTHPPGSVVCHVDNLGTPFPGRLVVSPLARPDPAAPRGRGLAISARLGRVELEGLIGGTRAVFRRAF